MKNLTYEQYKQMDEDGLLIKLPCKIGDSVYRIVNSIELIACCGCDGCTDEILGKDTKCDYFINDNCINQVENSQWYCIIRKRFRYEYIPYIGTKVFMTKEEAEEALEKILQERNY